MSSIRFSILIFMKILFFLFLLFFLESVSSQSNYKLISSDKTISNKEKNIKFDLLIKRYENENKLDSLVTETYEIIKWHYANNEIDKAIRLNKKNLALMDSINYKDHVFYRRNIYSLGFYESKNGETENALKNFKKLLDYKKPDEYSLKSTYEIAEIYFNIEGDYYKSLEYYKLCRIISKQLNDNTLLTRSTVGVGKSNLLINSDRSIEEAISITSNTIDYLESLSTIDVHNYYLIQIYKLFGNLHSDRNDYDYEIATYNLNKALEIAKKTGYYDEVSFINNDLGLINLKDKRPEAEDYFKNSLKYRTNNVVYAITHRNLAKHYIYTHNYELALQSIQKSIFALILSRPSDNYGLPDKDQLLSCTSKNQLLSSLIVKSDIWLKLAEANTNKGHHYHEQATKTIKLGDWLIDKARLSDIEYKSKLFWRKIATDLYVNGVKVSYETNTPEDAFYYFEKNKAIQLLEDVNLKLARKNTQIPEAISKKEKRLKDKIIELEKLKSSSNSEITNRDLILAKENYDEFINTLNTDLKLLYKLEKPAEVIDFSDLKNNLNLEEVYLEYILNEDFGYGLLISKNQLIIFQLPDLEQLKELSLNYRKHLNFPITTHDKLKEFNNTSHSLYKILFPEKIRSLTNGKKIIVVPDNFLQNIPFEPLITDNGDNKSFLILKNEISYSYSLTFLLKNKVLVNEKKNAIVGFAPIKFNDSLPNLKGSKEELEALNKLDIPNIYILEQANKENFYNKSKDARVIHIASHANASDNINPWISFYNEKLYLNEIYNHDTYADLVVLSACNTSLGEIYEGEGVMSLARGFFHSGSKSVLTTLWTVNDKSTSFVIKEFYENLKNGQSKSAALRNAKLTYLESHSLSEASPYYWSSFVLLGDDNTINFISNSNLILYLIIMAAISVIAAIIFKTKLNNYKRND